MDKFIELHEIVLRKKIKGSITVHYDGKGNCISEVDLKMKEDEALKHLKGKKNKPIKVNWK